MNHLFSIVGQTRILSMLHSVAEEGRYANAYLFHGPRGTGKEAMAMEFAAIMNCQSSGERPCGECQGCIQMRQLQHPNLQLLYALPGGRSSDKSDPLKGLSADLIETIQETVLEKSRNPYMKIAIPRAQNIKISSVRAMQKEIHLGLAEEGRKVVLIFEAERMTKEAFNSILKIVEEPPDHTSFIFCTSALHQIPETIQSRCQLVPFRPLTKEEIQSGLQNNANITTEEIRKRIARISEGDFGFALSLAEKDLDTQEEQILDFLRAAMQGHALTIREQVDSLEALHHDSKIEFRRFLSLVQLWFRDARLWEEIEDPEQLAFPQHLDKIQAFLSRYKSVDYTTVQVLLENAVDFIMRNVYIRLALNSLLIQLHRAIHGNLRGKPYGERHRYI